MVAVSISASTACRGRGGCLEESPQTTGLARLCRFLAYFTVDRGADLPAKSPRNSSRDIDFG